MIKVTVPATSANLGSGFDSLGLALTMYNTIYLEEYDGIDIRSLDDVEVPTDETNLIYSSAKRIYEIVDKHAWLVDLWAQTPFWVIRLLKMSL